MSLNIMKNVKRVASNGEGRQQESKGFIHAIDVLYVHTYSTASCLTCRQVDIWFICMHASQPTIDDTRVPVPGNRTYFLMEQIN